MHFYQNAIVKRLFLAVLCGTFSLGLTACGNAKGSKEELPEWTYVPEFVELEDAGDIAWSQSLLSGDALCYATYEWAEDKSTVTLHRYPLAGGEGQDVPLSLGAEENLNYWVPDDAGNVYAIRSVWNHDEASGSSTTQYFLVKYDPAGAEVLRQEITSLVSDGEYAYISGLSVDGQGRYYVLMDEQICLFDEQGNAAGSVPLDSDRNYVQNFGTGSDGKVWLSAVKYSEAETSVTLSSVNFETKSLEGGYENYPSSNASDSGSIVEDEEGDFLAFDTLSVYRYSPKTQQKEKLFDFLDCDINGAYVVRIGLLSDGRVAAVYQDWNSGDSGLALMTKKKTAEVPQKQRIVIASIFSGQDVQAAAVAFNKSSDTYHVQVRNYLSGDDWSEASVQDAVTRLGSDLTSGNCPDIILLDNAMQEGINVELLAAKGVFEDLAPWLEDSEVLDRGNMFESVLDAYTYDGTLVSIPGFFELETLVGAKSVVGEEPGWTLEEMIALADKNPEAQLLYQTSRQDLLSTCLQYNIDSFLDWESGSCSFDGEEFKALLSFVSHFPGYDEMTWDEDMPEEPEMIREGKVLLSDAYIYQLDMMQLYLDMFGEDITAIGYPNSQGYNGCILQTQGCYAIASKSGQKEGAWAFIESSLSEYGDLALDFGFPNNRSELDSMVESKLNVEYVKDENGELMLDENGEPIPVGGSHGMGWGDYMYYFRVPTREEIDMILDLIDGAKPAAGGTTEIMNIINEEAEAFFQGQKSVDDVADIIQKRIGVYVNENR